MLSTSPTGDSFASFDALLCEEVTRSAALAEENTHLRELLSEHPPSAYLRPSAVSPGPESPPTSLTDNTTALLQELAAARAAQEEMARELQALRESRMAATQRAAASQEDTSDEVTLLRESLALLASELEAEKTRVDAVETRRREEEEKVALLRTTVEESRRALMQLQARAPANRRSSLDPTRRGSLQMMSLSPSDLLLQRRRPSVGMCSPTSSTGLGLADSVPFRTAHHRGSASIHMSQEAMDEDDRLARLRDLRAGYTATKVSSRRGSTNSVFSSTSDYDFDPPERQRIPSMAFATPVPRAASFSGGSTLASPLLRPPSAPLRAMGRKQSVAVFDSFDSRGSSLDYGDISPFCTPPRSYSTGGSTPSSAQLMAELEDLRVRLAESEEGRAATQVALKALKEFVGDDVRLPPLPVDIDEPVARSSRWSIPRLPSLSRRSSNASQTATTPNLTQFARRRSSASSSLYNAPPPPTSAPSFGAFSFSVLTSPPIDDGETSPTMKSPASFSSSCGGHDVPGLDSNSESESSRASSPEAGEEETPCLDAVKVFVGPGDEILSVFPGMEKFSHQPSSTAPVGLFA